MITELDKKIAITLTNYYIARDKAQQSRWNLEYLGLLTPSLKKDLLEFDIRLEEYIKEIGIFLFNYTPNFFKSFINDLCIVNSYKIFDTNVSSDYSMSNTLDMYISYKDKQYKFSFKYDFITMRFYQNNYITSNDERESPEEINNIYHQLNIHLGTIPRENDVWLRGKN